LTRDRIHRGGGNIGLRQFAASEHDASVRERNTRAARRIPRALWRVAQRKLKVLDVAARFDDLMTPAGNRLEPLKGDRAGRYSIRINDQFRVTFRCEQGDAYEVRVEDYH
jgi:proteic killer suppression protein